MTPADSSYPVVYMAVWVLDAGIIHAVVYGMIIPKGTAVMFGGEVCLVEEGLPDRVV